MWAGSGVAGGVCICGRGLRFAAILECFGAQETAFAMLAEVTERALALTRAPHLLLVGGVACEWAGPHLGGRGHTWSGFCHTWEGRGYIYVGRGHRGRGRDEWAGHKEGRGLGRTHAHLTCAQVTTGCRRCCGRCAAPAAPSSAPWMTGECRPCPPGGGAHLGHTHDL